jgi:hypothetical protein
MWEANENPPTRGSRLRLASSPGLSLAVRERRFVATELVLLCRLAGMSVLNVWGGTAGNWRRGRLDLDEMEMMVVARKVAGVPNPPFGKPELDTAPGFGIMNAGQRGSARVQKAVERCWRHSNDRAERVAPERNVHHSFVAVR